MHFAIDLSAFDQPLATLPSAPFAFSIPFPPRAAQVEVVDENGGILALADITSKLLRDAVSALPSSAFVRNPSQMSVALLNKIAAFESQIRAGALLGARQKLTNDIRRDIAAGLLDNYQLQNEQQYTKLELLALVDELAARLLP